MQRRHQRRRRSRRRSPLEVVAENLLNPVGLALLPDGGVLVAEEGTGADDTSAGVSLVVDGRVERVVSGLPSSRDSGDSPVLPLVGVSPDGTTVYTAHFGAGSLLTFPTPSLKAVDAGALLGPGRPAAGHGAAQPGTARQPVRHHLLRQTASRS